MSSVNLERALGFLYPAEGADHHYEPLGGVTAFGITLAFAAGVGDLDGDGRPDLDVDGNGSINADDLYKLTREDASFIYERVLWLPLRCHELPFAVALPLFDAAVNQGRGPAVVMLQRALGVKDDGKFGPKTFQAACTQAASGVAIRLTGNRVRRYMNTRGFDTNGLGWVNRAFAALEYGMK